MKSEDEYTPDVGIAATLWKALLRAGKCKEEEMVEFPRSGDEQDRKGCEEKENREPLSSAQSRGSAISLLGDVSKGEQERNGSDAGA